jgi:hypothetical protein
MTSPSGRRDVLSMSDEAVAVGARLSPSCAMMELNLRTVQRWRQMPK